MERSRTTAEGWRGGARRPLLARIRGVRDLAALAALVYALASILAGLSHRPPVAEPTSQIAWILPDGSAAVVCLGHEADKSTPHGGASGLCDACLITAAPGLPPVAAAVIATRAGILRVPRPAEYALPARPVVASASARGPPSRALVL